MSEFSANFQCFNFNKPAASFPPCIAAMDPLLPNMDLSNCSNQFTRLNPSHLLDASSSFDFHSLMGFTADVSLFLPQQTAEFPGNFLDDIPAAFNLNNQKPVSTPPPPMTLPIDQQSHENKKRKALTTEVSESSSGFTYAPSPAASEGGIKKRQNSRKGKKVKANDQEEDKPREVVHVRARRGQATDSHSLAERVRRGKINERLRCLQDIVPGCYKTMGMAVMLDEIINYVQSLQNQVEFLSMKLTSASTLHDMNAEAAALQTLQRAKVEELQEMERLMRESYGGPTCFPPIWPQ